MKITKKIKNSRFFMEPGIAEISAGYANNVKYCQELRICLPGKNGLYAERSAGRHPRGNAAGGLL